MLYVLFVQARQIMISERMKSHGLMGNLMYNIKRVVCKNCNHQQGVICCAMRKVEDTMMTKDYASRREVTEVCVKCRRHVQGVPTTSYHWV